MGTVFYYGVRLLLAAGSIIGIFGAFLDVKEAQIILFAPLGLNLFHLGFGLFAISAFMIIGEMSIKVRRLEQAKPKIMLGDPKRYPKEELTHTYKGYLGLVSQPLSTSHPLPPPSLQNRYTEQITLYRVPVKNQGGPADSVNVRLNSVSPVLSSGLPNPILHLAGDNPTDHETYAQSRGFPMGRESQEYIDVIAVSKDSPHSCYLWSIASRDAVQEVPMDGHYSLTIAAHAGNVVVFQDYSVEVDRQHGYLCMTRL